MKIRIVTWLCGGAFRKKHQVIEDAYDPDILVVQECENPATSTAAYREWAGKYHWIGESNARGLGIFDRKRTGIELLSWPVERLQLFLPCRVASSVVLLGVWTKYANSPNFRYIGQLWKYLELQREKLAEQSACVVGDMNSNSRWDEWDRWWNHSHVVRELGEIGMQSVYHDHFKEAQGAETRPTLYHQKNLTKAYHIDYAFCSSVLKPNDGFDVQVGSPTVWLTFSDHMPLCFSVAY